MTKTDTAKPVKNTKAVAKEATEPSLIAPNSSLELTIDAKTASAAYSKALAKRTRTLKTDGFRRGKTPLAIAEAVIGAETLINDTLQSVVPAVYEAAIKQSGKIPLTYPEFNPLSIKHGEDWKLEAFFAERPVITLGNYKKVVKEALKSAQDHEKELAKEAAKLKKDKPEAPKNSETEAHEAAHKKEHFLQHIYADLVKAIKPQIPELLVKEDVRSELETLVERLQSMKLDLDAFLKQRNMTFEDLSRELTYQSLGRLQLTFILETITEAEKLTVDQAEIDAAQAKTADPELQKRYAADPRYQAMLRQTLMRQKLADFLLSL